MHKFIDNIVAFSLKNKFFILFFVRRLPSLPVWFRSSIHR